MHARRAAGDETRSATAASAIERYCEIRLTPGESAALSPRGLDARPESKSATREIDTTTTTAALGRWLQVMPARSELAKVLQ